MTDKQAIFWGAAGHAKVLRECIGHEGWCLVALFDNNPSAPPPFPDVPLRYGVAGFEHWLGSLHGDRRPGFLVAIGGDRGRARLELHRYLAAQGLGPIVARHPTAFIAPDARIGEGSQVLAHATISVEAAIGRECIINHGANVDHECRLADGVHVCPGAKLAGLVEVGDCAMIGTGAVVLPRIRIGRGAVIGAGAVVTRDVPPGAVVAGNPARILRVIDDV